LGKEEDKKFAELKEKITKVKKKVQASAF